MLVTVELVNHNILLPTIWHNRNDTSMHIHCIISVCDIAHILLHRCGLEVIVLEEM